MVRGTNVFLEFVTFSHSASFTGHEFHIYFRAGKPPTGLHLDVLKGDKLIQKLMIDEKKCYLFGRNPQMNDFCIDHASCSRVHAAFVYHKHLNRAFLVDLGSSKYFTALENYVGEFMLVLMWLSTQF